MKRRNGFTLIELLAIIVILAIIAVITVPLILDIIDNAKEKSVIDSAYGYKDAVNKYYAKELLKNKDYNLKDGMYSTGFFKGTIQGNQPNDNSFIEIENNSIVNGCLQFNEYKVEIADGQINEAEKDNCEEINTRIIINTDNKGRLYYNTEWINNNPIYLDPTNLENNCNENNFINTPETKSGCMKWYVYSENVDGTVNMILDHNTTTQIFWTSYMDNDNYVNYKGPREALYQLHEDTKNWNGVNKLSETDNYTVTWEKDLNDDTSISDDEKHSYTVDYTKHLNSSDSYEYSNDSEAHKARFIEAEEIAKIIGNNNWTINDSALFFDGSWDIQKELGKGNSKFSWLFNNTYQCEQYGCEVEEPIYNYRPILGYWTSTPHVINKENNLIVLFQGQIGCATTSTGGIRPVVKVSKSIIGI